MIHQGGKIASGILECNIAFHQECIKVVYERWMIDMCTTTTYGVRHSWWKSYTPILIRRVAFILKIWFNLDPSTWLSLCHFVSFQFFHTLYYILSTVLQKFFTLSSSYSGDGSRMPVQARNLHTKVNKIMPNRKIQAHSSDHPS